MLVIGTVAATTPARANPIQDLPGTGGIRLDATLEISVADGDFFDTTALAPDFYYGFSKALVFGITHSAASQGMIAVGRSLQINGPGDAYNGVAFEAFIPIVNTAPITIAPNVSFMIDQMDPLLYSIKAGGLISLSFSAISLVGMPHMVFPANDRDMTGINGMTRDNQLRVPIWLYYHWKSFFSLYLLSGVVDDSLQLGIGAVVSATESIRLGAQFGWPRFAGDNNTLDVAALSLFLQFVF